MASGISLGFTGQWWHQSAFLFINGQLLGLAVFFFQFFNQYTFHYQSTNFNVLHGTGFNVPVLKQLFKINIIQPCLRNKVSCPCDRHTNKTSLSSNQAHLSTKFSTDFSLHFIWVTTSPSNLAIFFRSVPTTEQGSFNSSVSFGACVNYIFGWVVQIFSRR